MDEKLLNKRLIQQKIAYVCLWGSAIFTLSLLCLIVGHILIQGISYVTPEFLFTDPEDMGRAGGIFSTIITTVYLTVLAIIIAAPLGVGAAVYLVEYTKENSLTKIIRFGNETLAGIPSIIYGLFGFAFLVMYLNFGWSLLSGALTIALMVLPVIIRTAEESLKTVPRSYREASLALGATKWQTIYKVVLPSAVPGIITGIILSIGRIIGETAPLILTLGGALYIPHSVFDPGRTMALHLYSLATEIGAMEKAYATAVVLIFTILLVNFSAALLTRYWKKKISG